MYKLVRARMPCELPVTETHLPLEEPHQLVDVYRCASLPSNGYFLTAQAQLVAEFCYCWFCCTLKKLVRRMHDYSYYFCIEFPSRNNDIAHVGRLKYRA